MHQTLLILIAVLVLPAIGCQSQRDPIKVIHPSYSYNQDRDLPVKQVSPVGSFLARLNAEDRR